MLAVCGMSLYGRDVGFVESTSGGNATKFKEFAPSTESVEESGRGRENEESMLSSYGLVVSHPK